MILRTGSRLLRLKLTWLNLSTSRTSGQQKTVRDSHLLSSNAPIRTRKLSWLSIRRRLMSWMVLCVARQSNLSTSSLWVWTACLRTRSILMPCRQLCRRQQRSKTNITRHKLIVFYLRGWSSRNLVSPPHISRRTSKASQGGARRAGQKRKRRSRSH